MSAGPFLYELDFVAVRILNEGDHGIAKLHRSGLAYNAPPLLTGPFTGGCSIINLECDVTEARAKVIGRGIPVVCEFDDRVVGFFPVANESQGEAPIRIILSPKEPHTQNFCIEIDGAFQIADANHGVKDSHGGISRWLIRLPGRRRGLRVLVGLNNAVDAMVSEEESHLIGIPEISVGAKLESKPGGKLQGDLFHAGF